MKKTFHILVFIGCLFQTHGQDTLNKFNSEGKKHGFWKKFLDKDLRPIDSAKSYFIALVPFDNGKDLINYFDSKWRSKDSIVHEQLLPNKGAPVLLNGTFKWYYRKKKIMYVRESYINGYPSLIQTFHYDLRDKRKDSDTILYLNDNIDYSKRYNNTPGSYYYSYNPVVNNNLREYWYRKVGTKWKTEEVKFEYSTLPIENEIQGEWEIVNDQKSGKTIIFRPDNTMSINNKRPLEFSETYKYEVVEKNKVKLINGIYFTFMYLYIKNKRLIVKYGYGNELYERKS